MERKVEENTDIHVKKGKRGRKKKDDAPKSNFYFSDVEEKALVEYLNTEDTIKRNHIYKTILHPAFEKMVECLIRRYFLYIPREDYKDTFNDTISFLLTRLEKFDPTKNFKAYSFCGTVCKNYLILKKQSQIKQINREYAIQQSSISDVTDYDDDDYIPYEQDETFVAVNTVDPEIDDIAVIDDAEDENEDDINDKDTIFSQLLKEAAVFIQNRLDTQDCSEKEVLIGNGLIELINNWENIFNSMGDNKFNKTFVLYYISEYTMLPVQDVKKGLKQYKKLYKSAKDSILKKVLHE